MKRLSMLFLPVGISFYTFHGLSYIFDIYYGKIRPTKSYVNYSLFVSYFPLLVAGPIERANHLLPQIEKPRIFQYSVAVDGLKQILWGFFKKVVIADNCAEYANMIFNHSDAYSGSVLLLGAIFFTFQIYGDFSGYSDIALGSSNLLGIQLLKNFSFLISPGTLLNSGEGGISRFHRGLKNTCISLWEAADKECIRQ